MGRVHLVRWGREGEVTFHVPQISNWSAPTSCHQETYFDLFYYCYICVIFLPYLGMIPSVRVPALPKQQLAIRLAILRYRLHVSLQTYSQLEISKV
jgi:hypothetical protein